MVDAKPMMLTALFSSYIVESAKASDYDHLLAAAADAHE